MHFPICHTFCLPPISISIYIHMYIYIIYIYIYVPFRALYMAVGYAIISYAAPIYLLHHHMLLIMCYPIISYATPYHMLPHHLRHHIICYPIISYATLSPLFTVTSHQFKHSKCIRISRSSFWLPHMFRTCPKSVRAKNTHTHTYIYIYAIQEVNKHCHGCCEKQFYQVQKTTLTPGIQCSLAHCHLGECPNCATSGSNIRKRHLDHNCCNLAGN